MWWAGAESAHFYIGRDRLTVWAPKAEGACVHQETIGSVADGCLLGAKLLGPGSLLHRHRVVVWLSAALARPFIFPSVAGLRRWSEVVRAAAGMAPDATGLDRSCSVWLDDWVPGEATVAIAVNQAEREAIEAALRSQMVSLVAIRPWWVAAVNVAAKAHTGTAGLLAVEERDAVTILSTAQGRFTSAATYSPRPDDEQSRALLTRALMGANLFATHGVRARVHDSVADATDMHRVPAPPFAVRLEPLACER